MNRKELTMRRTIVALLSFACLFGTTRPAAAAESIPTVTIMLSGTGEFETDLEAIMKMGGEDAYDQWPVIQAVLPAFTGGIDPDRPIRVDIIFGKERDYRISIPYVNQKAILQNIQGFLGGKPRRIGSGLYSLKSAAFTGYIRDYTKLKYVVIAADRNNIPSKFDPLPDIQPLIDAGYDVAASVKNTADGVDDRKKAIDDLRKELLGGLKKTADESDLEFEIRRVGLVHQLEELERLFAESESLVLGWTTDAPKKEARMDLELTALPETDLAKSIIELAAKPSLFSSAAKTEKSMFFGRVNHSLDQMRKEHLDEMLTLLTGQTIAKIVASESLADDEKNGAKDGTTAFFDMLKKGSVMGVFDGYSNIEYGEKGRSIVGTIKAADGTMIDGVLASMKAAGWEIELAEPGAAKDDPAAVVKDDKAKPDGAAPKTAGDKTVGDKPADKGDDSATKETAAKAATKKTDKADVKAKPAAEPAAADEKKEVPPKKEAAPAKDAAPKKEAPPASAKLAIHKVKIPAVGQSDFQNLFGKDVTLLVAGTKGAVYYAAGPEAEDQLRKAVADTGEDQTKNDGTFIETYLKLGPWLSFLKERRERREALEDPVELNPEEKSALEERIKIRDMAIDAFSKGQDTIHMQLKSDQKKVTGLTVYAEGILRFVGVAVADFAATKLQ
jgi:hypothetical protein